MPGRNIVQIVEWRATVDEDRHYSFAIPRDAAARHTRQSTDLRRPAISHYA